MPSIEWIKQHLSEMFEKAQGDPFEGKPPTMTFEQGLRAWQCAVMSTQPAPWWSGVVASAGNAEDADGEEQASTGCCGGDAPPETGERERGAAPGSARAKGGVAAGTQPKDSGPAKKKQPEDALPRSEEGNIVSEDEEKCLEVYRP